MAVLETAGTFVSALVGVAIIAVCALIAFCMTCVPAGFVAMSAGGESGLTVALVIGGTAAVAAGAYTTYFLLTRKRRSAGTAGKP